jgi:adenylate cyclase
MSAEPTPQEEWAAFLSGTHPHLQDKSPLRFIPSSPRCRICSAPFGGPGAFVLRRYGYTPWEKNPKVCGRCFKGIETVAKMCPTQGEDGEIHGAEVELSMLFADVRGSSKLAREMPTWDFTRLMNRFYTVSKHVLVEADAIIEKFVGDEVVALFLPLMTGPDHARRAVESAEALLRATGHGEHEQPWVPLGAGVHTGVAFVGVVGTKGSSDFTALGDPVNIASHLASQAAAGEILMSNATAAAAAMAHDDLERRHVSLKGHPLDALVLRVEGPVQTGRPAGG